MSAPYFWWSLKAWVCTTGLSCLLHQLPLLLSPSPVLAPIAPHQLSTGILPPESVHWFLGSCWQEEGAGGRAVCCGSVPVRALPERALELLGFTLLQIRI